MPLFRSSPFEDLVIQATSEKNITDDWALILDICDKAVNYEEGAKSILQAITKRLYNNVPRVVLQALLLLDSCVKNCGKRFLLEVSSRNFVAELQKLLTKMHPTTVDKLKGLIRKWAEQEFKDDPELGLIPSLYYKLKSEGLQFPEEISEKPTTPALCTNPDAVSSQEEEEDIVKAIALSLKDAPQTDYLSNGISNYGRLTESLKVELLKVRALYDFEAVEDNELTIKAGEMIVVIDKSNDSWWKGTNQRGEGYFPTSFVTEDLEAKIEPLKEEVKEPPEILKEKVVEKPIVIDEQKMQMALHLLNETDPTDECPDDESLLELERECYAMTPLIEEKLQQIDRRFTVLNSLNDEIMKAIQSFYKLTRDSMIPPQYVYCYNVPTDPATASQQMQDNVPVLQSNQSSGAIPRPTSRQVATTEPSSFYIAPGFFPNLTNLSSNQIRENVESLSFVHPSQLHQPYYNMLSSKLPNIQVTTSSRHNFQNVAPYASISSSQPPAKMNSLPVEENGDSRAAISSSGNLTNEGQLSYQSTTDNPNYANAVRQHIPLATTTTITRNVPYRVETGDSMSSTEARTSTELSLNGQQLQSCTMPRVPLSETATTSAIHQETSNSLNTSAIISNPYLTMAILPDNIASPERHQENTVPLSSSGI